MRKRAFLGKTHMVLSAAWARWALTGLVAVVLAPGAFAQAPAATTDTQTTTATASELPSAPEAGHWELLSPMVVEKLDNGMTFLLYPNRRAPIFSAVIRYDVGGKNETPGITGIAHMFEHMAFKGTRRIGTTNWTSEQKALEAVERAAQAYDGARNAALREDLDATQTRQRIAPAREAFEKAKAEAAKFVVGNEFEQIYNREGAADLNAHTSADATGYEVSLPANRIELWARMESERLTQPVMREFYSERDVVMEERRMSYDSDPMRRLYELTIATAYTASPYSYPVIGYASDIQNLTATEAYAFYKKNYTPDRAVGAIVGDIDVEKTRQLLRETFGKIPARAPGQAEDHLISEPPQQGERRVTLRAPATPMLYLSWHKPSAPSRDDVTASVLMQILTGGRSARWFEELVKQKRLATDLGTFSAPGDALPNLFIVGAYPNAKVAPEQLEKELRAAVARLRTEPVSAEELSRAKKNLRADTVRALEENMGLASQLSEAAQIGHDPYYLERRLRQLETVTAADIEAFAQKYLVDDNLTVSTLLPPEGSPAEGGAAQANDQATTATDQATTATATATDGATTATTPAASAAPTTQSAAH